MSSGSLVKPINLDNEALGDIAMMLRHGDSISSVVAAAATELPAATLLAFSDRIDRKLGLEGRVAYEIFFALLQISQLQHSRKISGAAVFALTAKAICDEQDQTSWRHHVLEEWKKYESSIVDALDQINDDHPAAVSKRAQQLAYSHPNVLISSRIITDIRPVFDSAASKIVESVIAHTLLIHYTDASQNSTVATFALDAADVAELKKACDRAEAKASVVQKQLSHLNPVVLPEG